MSIVKKDVSEKSIEWWACEAHPPFFNFRIENRAGKEMVDSDHISRQTNLPDAAQSEEL